MDKKTYSVYLSKALDALGFGWTWKLCGESLTADEDGNVTDMIAGSKAEGVSRVFEGDYDMMVSLNDLICYGSIDDMEEESARNVSSKKYEISKETTTILYQRKDVKSEDANEYIESSEDHVRTFCRSMALSNQRIEIKSEEDNSAIFDDKSGSSHPELGPSNDEVTCSEHNVTSVKVSEDVYELDETNVEVSEPGATNVKVSELGVTNVKVSELSATNVKVGELGVTNVELGETNDEVSDEPFCLKNVVETSIENSEEIKQPNAVLLMDTENVSPGYTILKVLHLDDQKLLEYQVQEYRAVVNAKTDRNGECVLSSDVFSTDAYECDEDEYTESVAGPAGRSVANKELGIVCDIDSVFCIPCVCKRINRSWVERKRKFNWPSKELIEVISRLDGHVVPVGFKGSETSNLEWRVCYTESEIELVRSFNETQIQLHALVKIVGKGLLQPHCPDITSYILKNLLLWMAEKIPTERFEKENLYGLLMVALKFLRHSVLERKLPNYMIPRRNLFLGKLPEDERTGLLKALDKLINDKYFFIERHEELEFLSKYIHIAANNPELADYMGINRLQLEIVSRQNWREVCEDRVYNFLPVCLKQCSCLKSLVCICDMVGVSSKTRQLVIAKMFWWITGRTAEGNVVDDNDDDGSTIGDAYWAWNENGDVRCIYESKILSAEELDAFFNDK